jgi:hypothetical protein
VRRGKGLPCRARTPDACPSKPAFYCPSRNAVAVDLPALQQMGQFGDEAEMVLPQGDNTSISVVTSRYTLAVQREHGLRIDSPVSALRTACLTGVAQRKMADPIPLPSGKTLVLTAGDIDEAVAAAPARAA